MASTTNFTADIVPQAPEDPLFGLMRAYRADESTDKVDLVSSPLPSSPLLPSRRPTAQDHFFFSFLQFLFLQLD